MNGEVTTALYISAIFLAIFAFAEILRKTNACSMEGTRKLVHLLAGAVSLSFAYIIRSHWTLLVMCIGFIAIVRISKKYELLNSIHGVKRKSTGDILHPLAIYLTYLWASFLKTPDFYLISILVLSISDTLAALIGSSYGFKLYDVEEERKSLEGSLIFFLSTFLIVHLGLLLLTEVGRLECVLAALLIAILVTCFEAVSLGGADNLFVPTGTLFILSKFTKKPIPEMVFQLCSASIIFLLSFIVSKPTDRLGSSGIIGVALTGYAAWSLIGPEWYIPVLICNLLIAWSDCFLESPGSGEELFRIRPVFYMFVVSFIWILAANFSSIGHQYFFVPYIVSISAILSIRWEWHRRTVREQTETKQQFTLTAGRPTRAVVLSVIFLAFHIACREQQLAPLYSLVTCAVGVYIADSLYWIIGRPFHGKWSKTDFLRMGMGVVGAVTAALFILNLNYY